MRSFIILFACFFSTFYGESYPPQRLIVKSTYGAGFFAEVHKILDAVLHFSKENLKSVEVDWSDEFFLYKNDPHENGWHLYFEPIDYLPGTFSSEKESKEICGAPYHEIHDYLCVDQWVNYSRYLPYRLKVHEVIRKYLKVKTPIAEEVESIFNQKMAGHYCIGVHVRYGSDHSSETPLGNPRLEEYISEIKRLRDEKFPQSVRIYLATDSHFVVKAFQKAFPPSMLVFLDTFRTEYRDVPHLIYGNGDYWLAHKEEFHRKKPGYVGGKGVLMDALLLARCHLLVHSTSNIASFVSFYNPYIESLCLPKNTKTWACRHGKDL